MKHTQRELVNRGGVAYVVTTWDDETGDAEIREFDGENALLRRCVWTHWPTHERKDSVIGEAVWFDPHGVELETRPLREQGGE
jgi:hypothetical protein